MALNPAKARVLLKLALTKSQDPTAIQTYFDTY
jgi:L-asparaginase/Glu-tRNA(Gln) amidotransferase subunit D